MARIMMIFDKVNDGDMLAQIGDVLRKSQQDGHELVAIIPALDGVTEQLQQSIELNSYERVQNKLLSIHSNVARRMVRNQQDRSLLIQDIEDMLGSYGWMGRSIANRRPTPAETATMLATGERLSTRLLTAYLQHEGIRASAINAQEVILSSDDFLAAAPDAGAIHNHGATQIKPLLRARNIVLIGANIAGTSSGQTTRLAPDSIYLAYSLLAAACECTGLWLMQRRNGIMLADPRLLPEAQSVPVLPLHILDDLASYGLSVPPASAFSPAVTAHIPIYIRNMNNPAHPGTYVHPQADPETALIIVTQKRMHHLSIGGTSRDHAEIVHLLAANKLPVLATDATFLIPAEQILGGRSRLSEILPDAQFAVSNDSGALITLIGLPRDMSPYIESALRAAQIQPARLIVTTGYSSRRHLSILVPLEQLETAVRQIHKVVARQPGDLF